MSGVAPVAFVYDRCASRSLRQLEIRMAGCDSYADRRGWVLAGRWIDLGEGALTEQRPQLGALLEAMYEEADRCEVLCLVHNWGRLSADGTLRLALQTRLVEAGGWTETTFGESDRRGRTLLVGRRP
ncbi:recombinase family protein [Streptomyces sp. DSM 41527]|uniref:Recombinase family protein n=1 Tax=Streptomyces mooreae TaxID=3075523 RepID=A0ABU2TFD9_9ACTN|nr:recombinase family protein [Streptomyces sp. DSM 41527]MDT0459631.1 recombinase family protein [Streptomyces sp. DSM 41527]